MGRKPTELALTDYQKEIIRENYSKMRVVDLARKLSKSTRSIYRYLNELGYNTPVRIRKNYARKPLVEVDSEYFRWEDYSEGIF